MRAVRCTKLSLLWLIVAAGCGPTFGAVPDGGGSTDGSASTGQEPGPDTDGVDASDGGAASTGDSTASMGDDDGDDGSDTSDPTPSTACIEDGELARAVAVADPDAQVVTVIDPVGGTATWSASLPAGVDHPAYIVMAARDDFLAVGTGYSTNGQFGTVVRLFDRAAGGLVWERQLSGHRLGNVYVDAQGRVVITAQWPDAPSFAGVVLVDGVPTAMPTFEPAGAIDPEGWIAGRFANQGDVQGAGFHNPDTQALVTVFVGQQPSGYRATEGTIEYIDDDSAIPRLVTATPTGETDVQLDAFADADGLVTMMARAGAYRLVATPAADPEDPWRLLRVHVQTGDAVLIDATPPEGWLPFDCYDRKAAIDVDGRVLFELRTDGVAQMHAYDPQSATWDALGEAVTGVEDILTAATFGTVHHIVTHGEGETFCPPVPWTGAPGYAPSGGSSQLARIDPPFVAFLEYDGYGAGATVDPDERCASWVDARGRRIHDMDDGEELMVAGRGSLVWLP